MKGKRQVMGDTDHLPTSTTAISSNPFQTIGQIEHLPQIGVI